MKNLATMCTAMLVVLIAVLGCSRFSTLGNVDLYEGDNAAKAAAAIKEKIGASKISVKVKRIFSSDLKLCAHVYSLQIQRQLKSCASINS